MPRPGPRPYECVRRAWHSDRHHPIRGSLIQEIFRMVNEVHSSGTRKNREWQEKLPIVVLKAEEILYSKANSEVEYSDFKTLWDRVNDAINTIIRRDESAETGKFLLPCIEAALHLGCTPRRSSRSERNESPRLYLRPETPVAIPFSANNSNVKKVYGKNTSNDPLVLHHSPFSTNDTMNYNDNKKIPVLPKNFASSDNHHAQVQNHASSNTWSVYPLYCNTQIQPNDQKLYSSKPSNSCSHLMESDKLGLQQNPSLPSKLEHTSNVGHEIKCDLTLRLGSLVIPRASNENSWLLESENGKSSTWDGRKFKSCLNK